MGESLDDIRFLLSTAARHIDTLQQQIATYFSNVPPDRWGERKPFDLVTKPEQEFGNGIWRVARYRNVRVPPRDLRYEAGQAVHDTRKSLDHLASALVRANGKQPTNKTVFPIIDELSANPRVAKSQIAKMSDALKGMRGPHQQSIKDLQPYKTPTAPGSIHLSALARLDNFVKHDRPIPVVLVQLPPSTPLILSGAPPGSNPEGFITPGPIVDGAECMRYRSDALGGFVQPSAAHEWDVAFGADMAVPFGHLRLIRDYVVGVVESFGADIAQV